MERQSKGSRGLEAYCNGGQGPPRAVAPLKKKKCVRVRVLFIDIQHAPLHGNTTCFMVKYSQFTIYVQFLLLL